MKKAIDVNDGSIQLSNGFILDKSLSFEAFQKTRFDKEQDKTTDHSILFGDIKAITLSPAQEIGGEEFITTIQFKNGWLGYVSLVSTMEFSEKDEPLRKEHHDKLLQRWQIECGKYDWGKIESKYDSRGNISSINIFYEMQIKDMIDIISKGIGQPVISDDGKKILANPYKFVCENDEFIIYVNVEKAGMTELIRTNNEDSACRAFLKELMKFVQSGRVSECVKISDRNRKEMSEFVECAGRKRGI